MTRFWWSYRSS